MLVEWSLVSFIHHTITLWRSEAVGGLFLQWLRENVYLALILRRGSKTYLTVG